MLLGDKVLQSCFTSIGEFVSAGFDAKAFNTLQPADTPLNHLLMLPDTCLWEVTSFLGPLVATTTVVPLKPNSFQTEWFESQLTLKITNVEMMDPKLAMVYPNVNLIIVSRAESTKDMLILSAGFSDKLVDFISTFQHLRHVVLRDLVYLLTEAYFDPTSVDGLRLEKTIRALCEAYATGVLSMNVAVERHNQHFWLFCPREHEENQPQAGSCHLCRRVLETFPIEHVLCTADVYLAGMDDLLDLARRIPKIWYCRFRNIQNLPVPLECDPGCHRSFGNAPVASSSCRTTRLRKTLSTTRRYGLGGGFGKFFDDEEDFDKN